MSDVARRSLEMLSPSKPAPGSIGIVRYLKDTLQGGVSFVVPKGKHRPAGKKHKIGSNFKQRGLAIGSYTDHLFTRAHNYHQHPEWRKTHPKKVEQLVPNLRKHHKCIQMFQCLKKLGVHVVRTQLRVSLDEYKLVTPIDAVGYTDAGEIVVIELKTTQFDLEEHNRRYKLPCIGKAKLVNGLDNTEHGLFPPPPLSCTTAV